METVGIVGLGLMGCKCAEKLLENNVTLCGYDPFPKAAERAAGMGITVCATARELAATAPIIIMFVPGPAECDAVAAGAEGLLAGVRAGGIVLNMSTVDPMTNIRLGETFSAKGAWVLDTPVLGSPYSAGSWAFAVGGEAEQLKKVEPVLLLLSGSADRIFHVGALGNGNRLKLLNNMMLGAINACASEIMALAAHMGLSQKMLIDAAVTANARTISNAYREIGERIVGERYDEPTFTVDMLVKDNRLCLEMARQAGAPLALGASVDYIHRLASAQGYGRQDHAVAWKAVLNTWAQPDCSPRETRGS